MKMFALESGENQTPKDKLKISRAQRDIDAVHWEKENHWVEVSKKIKEEERNEEYRIVSRYNNYVYFYINLLHFSETTIA